MSIEQVANRVFYYGSNDSFVLAFWNQRVDTPQVVTEMAAQALMLNVDRCTKNHVYAHLKGARFARFVYASLADGPADSGRQVARDPDGRRGRICDGLARWVPQLRCRGLRMQGARAWLAHCVFPAWF